MAFLQFTYIIIISIIKLFYYIYLFLNNKLEVRNSPLDKKKIASFGLNFVACVKGRCQYGLGAGAALGLDLSIDVLLVRSGREPVFKDALAKHLDNTFFFLNLGIENPNKDITKLDNDIKTLKYRYSKLIDLNKDIDDVNSFGEEAGLKN